MITSIDIFGSMFIVVMAALGLRAGFFSTFMGVLAVYLAAYIGSSFATPASSNFTFYGVEKHLAYTIIFLLVFLVFYLIGEFVIWIFRNIISVRILGIFDTLLATFFGAVKALLIMGIIFDLVVAFPLSDEAKNYLEMSRIKEISLKLLRRTFPLAQASIPKFGRFVELTISGEESSITPPSISPELVAKTIKTVSKEATQAIKELTE